MSEITEKTNIPLRLVMIIITCAVTYGVQLATLANVAMRVTRIENKLDEALTSKNIAVTYQKGDNNGVSKVQERQVSAN